MPVSVLLGNSAVRSNGESLPELGNKLTVVSFPDGYPAADHLAGIKDLWLSHSDADGPEWVECEDDPLLAEIVARHFTTDTHDCTVGRPDGWQED